MRALTLDPWKGRSALPHPEARFVKRYGDEDEVVTERNGCPWTVEACQLVPGDMIRVETLCRVVANEEMPEKAGTQNTAVG